MNRYPEERSRQLQSLKQRSSSAVELFHRKQRGTAKQLTSPATNSATLPGLCVAEFSFPLIRDVILLVQELGHIS